MRRSRLPVDLPLLPGLRWKGKLRVLELAEGGGAVVAFDAEIVAPPPGEPPIVYDRATLTAAQLLAWTGVSANSLRGTP